MSDFEDASLILTPNAYKAGKAYCVKPFDGSGDLTVVRNTTATYRDENGLIKTALANEPRLNYPIGGGCPSWLIELQSTNYLTQSNDFSTWILQSGTVVTPNSATSPDGTLNASKVTSNGSNGLFKMVTQTGLITRSVYLRSVSGSETVKLKDPQLTQTTLNLNLTEEWQRFNLTEDNNFSSSGIWIDDISSSGIYIWGAQLEQGGLTSYIPTDSTAVTRNADVLTVAPPSGTTEIVETLEDITYYIGGRNLVTNSEDFTQGWSVSDATITSNSITSPSGQDNASTLTTSASGGATEQTLTISDGNLTFSLFVRKGTTNGVRLRIDAATDVNGFFNINDGTIFSQTDDAKIEVINADWYRVSISANVTSFVKASIYTTDGTTSYDNGTVYIWGAQVEQGGLTDYQATRDIVVVPTTYQLPNGEIEKVIMK